VLDYDTANSLNNTRFMRLTHSPFTGGLYRESYIHIDSGAIKHIHYHEVINTQHV